jgi:hypothetical protein
MSILKIEKKKDPITERLSLPVSVRQKMRYYALLNELDKRELTKLHDLTRARIDKLLDEVEQEIGA